MKEEFSLKMLGNIPSFESLSMSVSQFSDQEWNKYRDRAKAKGLAAENSDTIPLLYDPRQKIHSGNFHENYKDFEKYINEIREIACSFFGEIEPKQAMLTRLHSGVEIKRHRDRGPLTARTHRVHLSVVTNELCIFTVGEESINMKSGEVWAIDNVGKYHSVKNGGDNHRIHLIIDFYPDGQ
jgi:aspartyl/asparaginyl beta-hydroxylase (cupin superfamily)